MDSIRLSGQLGVNPMLITCFVCNEDTGTIALLGKLKGDRAAPYKGVLDEEPCDNCKAWMEKGVILISTRAGSEGSPYRTGGWAVLKDEAVERFPFDEGMISSLLQRRVGYLEDEVWDMLGLPCEAVAATKEKTCIPD